MLDQVAELQALTTHRHPGPPSDDDENRVFAEVLEFIDLHYDEHLSLEAVAEVASLSKYHFSRRFHSTVGMTYQDYLANKRLMKAEELLLRAPNRALTRIALEVGFGSLRNMEKHFRSRVGLTPSEYREYARPQNATSFASRAT